MRRIAIVCIPMIYVGLVLTSNSLVVAAASAECLKVDEADTGNKEPGCGKSEPKGQWIEATRDVEVGVGTGLFCAQVTEANTGNYGSLTECVKGEHPGVSGQWIKVIVKLNKCGGGGADRVASSDPNVDMSFAFGGESLRFSSEGLYQPVPAVVT